MGTLGPMDIGVSEHWGEMGTRKIEHQSKWAFGANGHFGANGRFGTDRHWGKWAPEKMSTKANGYWAIGANKQFGQMGVWVIGLFGTNGIKSM